MIEVALSAIVACLGLGGGSIVVAEDPGDEASDPSPGLSFADGVPKREREPLQTQFEEVLGQACEPPPCIEDCEDDEAILSVELSRDDRDYALEWVVRDPRLTDPVTRSSTCELCSLVELETQLAADLRTLCQRLSTLEGSPAVLRVTSDPSGAAVRIDGKKVGTTPWSGELEEGEHVVEVRLRGYEDESRTLQLVGGVEEQLSLALMSEMPTGPVTKPRPYWPGWAGIGAGVVLGIAGTALIAADGKDFRGDCEGANVDAYGNCRFVYNTAALGAGLAAFGAAAFGAGVGLLVWAQHGRAGTSAGVGISGSF